MVRCVLIDDEPLSLSLLSDYLGKTEGFEVVGSYSDPIRALQGIQELEPDLLFLDVQMPELTGIQVLKILNRRYPVIMTTAYESYAIDGFEHQVLDYLLKPISYDRFLIALRKFQEQQAPNTQAMTTEDDFIFVKSEYKVQKINLQDILYLEGLGDYVAIHTREGKVLTLENMGKLAESLPTRQFMRVHRSYIVAFAAIDYIERNRIAIGEARIPVSDTYKKAFWERINGG